MHANLPGSRSRDAFNDIGFATFLLQFLMDIQKFLHKVRLPNLSLKYDTN